MMFSRRNFIKLTALSTGVFLFDCGSTRRSVKKSAMYNNSIDTLILDFDGTLTNIEKEAKPYVEGLSKLGTNLSEQERRALLAKLYLENYPKMSESFKEGVDEFLSEVWDLFEG